MMHTFQQMKSEEARKAGRGAQRKPTQAEIAEYYETLRAHAKIGNLFACAALIALAEGKPLAVVQT
jgi:hypothetical protein